MKLFGTDGIRGRSNQDPILPSQIVRIGQALGVLLTQDKLGHRYKQQVLIGKDTRISGYMIEMALASGLNSMGVHVLLVGPLPTPGIGFLARNMRSKAGIVISASHNQYYDNGIKIFGSSGFKISKSQQEQIEDMVQNACFEDKVAEAQNIGRSKRIDDAGGRYILHVKSHFPQDATLEGMRLVLDCANGACYKVAPQILEELGAEVIVLHNTPNGFNINKDCGACYPEKAAHAVREHKAHLGISLDGDGDRVVLLDEQGQVVNGDHILAISALYAKETGTLRNNTVVITDMSNLGLEQVLSQNGIRVVKSDVGDRHVVEKMRELHCGLGGESSGHIIFLENATTGDGLITALNVLKVMKAKNKPLSQLKSFQDVPSLLRNLHVSEKKDLDMVKGYKNLLAQVEEQLIPDGKIFVRFSGTEPVIRISLQGPCQKTLQAFAEKIASHLQSELGDPHG